MRSQLEAVVALLGRYSAKRWALDKPLEKLSAFMCELQTAELAQVGRAGLPFAGLAALAGRASPSLLPVSTAG
jgi:hypothetical protein